MTGSLWARLGGGMGGFSNYDEMMTCGEWVDKSDVIKSKRKFAGHRPNIYLGKFYEEKNC